MVRRGGGPSGRGRFRSSSLPEPGQCCPNVERQRRNSDLISKEEFVLQPGLDFNSNRCICEPVMLSIAGPADEPRQTGFRSDHGAPAVVDLQTLRCSLRRRAQGQTLLLSRPISVHGVCATHTARELTRYRGLPASTELFFKWIKQHLRIKAFFGTTENAVKTQIWIAVFAIVKKR